MPSNITGLIKVHGSKSESIRYLLASLITEESYEVTNINFCDDVNSTIEALKSLGIEFVVKGKNLKVYPKPIKKGKYLIDVGESALLLRMILPILSALGISAEVTGVKSILTRDQISLINSLEQNGIKVKHNNYKLPISIEGALNPNNIKIDSKDTSQVLSGFLYVSTLLPINTELRYTELKSKPYVDLTISILKNLGFQFVRINDEGIIYKGKIQVENRKFAVSGDWSSAAYLMIAAAMKGKIDFRGLDIISHQADRIVLSVLEQVGANLKIASDRIIVEKKSLNEFKIDCTDSPDIIPALMVLATQCEGASKIQGINRLKNKESNRLEVMTAIMDELNINFAIKDDTISISKSNIKGGEFGSQGDHRIAFALSLIGIISENAVKIYNENCVSKSYPNFYSDLISLGAKINE